MTKQKTVGCTIHMPTVDFKRAPEAKLFRAYDGYSLCVSYLDEEKAKEVIKALKAVGINTDNRASPNF